MMDSHTFGLISRTLIDAYWHPLCLTSQVAKDKDYIRFDIFGFEVVVFNDNGNLIAFDNRCPHRGARFFTGDRGNQKVLCQYHGWGYGSGKLRVAGSKHFSHCDIESASLNFFQLAQCGELIFFSVHPEKTLEEQLGSELFSRLALISSVLGDGADFNRYSFTSDWPIALENALEPYHIPMVHRDTLATLKLGVGDNQFLGQNSIWFAPIESDRMSRRLSSLSRFFTAHDAYPGYMSIFIFPFSMLSSTCGYSYSMQNFFPSASPGMTHFTSQLYPVKASSERFGEIVSAFIDSTRDVNRQVFLEDQEVCTRVPLDTWSWQPPRYYSELETKLLHFRESCAQWASRLKLDGDTSIRRLHE